MLVALGLWLWLAKDHRVVPGFRQWVGEQLYNLVRNGIGREALGHDYRRFTPYLVALFSFILVNNLFGQFFLSMFPTFSRVGYAYGLAIWEEDGMRIFEHDGGIRSDVTVARLAEDRVSP